MQDQGSQFHPIEKSLLNVLSKIQPTSIEKLSQATGLNIDQVRRGIEWLKYKNLISIRDKSIVKIMLGKNGLNAIELRLPERRLVEAVKRGFNSTGKLADSGIFNDKNESTVAFRHAVHINKWLALQPPPISGEEATLVILPSSEKSSMEEVLLNKIHLGSVTTRGQISNMSQAELKAYDTLKKRHLIFEHRESNSEIILSDKGIQLVKLHQLDDERQNRKGSEPSIGKLTSQLISTGKWKDVRFSPLDVAAPTPSIHAGKKHPLQNLIDDIKEAFVGMGFLEIEGPLVQPSFWNFDVLFTPQDHPAREMQDSFYLHKIKQATITRDPHLVENVSEMHRKGWRYDWDPEEAKRAVLRTHTTPVTIKYLSDNEVEDAKVFTVGRVFRNEKTSYKHLVEFNQIEGVVTGSTVTLRDLMGLQIEFYSKLGIKKVRFWPTFFPYTEPSLQSMIYNKALGKWVELFGMGIFRPEVTGPLGIRNPVLAWGGGIERIAMLRFGLNDVRDLYANKLGWLRSVPRYQL